MSKEEHAKAKEQYDQFWSPVESLFRNANTKEQVKSACETAQSQTGHKYCFGIAYHGDPMKEDDEHIEFHGWLYDEGHDMISVWYLHEEK